MASIWNIPNFLTLIRILLVPVFLYCITTKVPFYRLMALVVFVVASITDFLDGYLARKWKQDTAFGRFMDPLADKALVLATLLVFLYLDPQIPLWMVLTIIARDMLVTLMRYLAIRKGMEIRTTRLAKAKTAFQMTSIILILMIFFVRSFQIDIQQTFEEGHRRGKKNIQIASELLARGLKILKNPDYTPREKKKVFAESIPYFLMLLTTIITVISGLRYLFTNYQVLLPPYRIIQRE
ncbi:MAG: CDP-diacylglycerol--glycerol-3-phosphate 3-phosphatidyltransferase [Leptospiraceae bacterium]|nr:CDP-diacylglycerol--glycerol-3-phosphate 3-phosphatidyltransferase [Leptospiraceae bacterium]MDW8305655.1 CDP-diacylglycerol--glycerol-3-phosphate 3-phosphatidyltransferase [Leptospiraceae bacterium]